MVRQPKFLNRHFYLFLSALPLTGCASAHYLSQALRGQLEIQNRARPIAEVLQDERVQPHVKALLAEISAIKDFGQSRGLKPTRNYTEYTDLKRRAVVWSVSACDELRFKAKEWAFPVVGSFTYLGWFSEPDAKKHADDLKAEGLDVDVGAVPAYSTLGWFRDPVLSTMLGSGEGARGSLVNTILHESVHATIYVNDQSTFNESVASFIADTMTPEYLTSLGAGIAEREQAAIKANEERHRRWRKLLHEAYLELESVYQGTGSDAEKRSKKTELLGRLSGVLKKEFNTDRVVNNATLMLYKTYDTSMDQFSGLHRACGGQWPKIIEALKSLTPNDFEKKQTHDFSSVLAKLSSRCAS